MPEFEGVFERREGSESFDVELEADKQYIIDVIGASSDLGRLRYAGLSAFVDDVPVSVNYNYDSNGYIQAVIKPLVTETYTLELDSFGATGGYTLRVFEDDFRYHPEGYAPAGDLETGGTSRGRINYDGDTDIHEVGLIAGLTYELKAMGADSGSGSLSDPELRLWSRFNTVAADNADAGSGADDRLVYTPKRTDVYYLDVRGADDERGSYDVTASAGRGTGAADRIRGTDAADAVNALGGADDVRGGGRSDVLSGADGRDALDGQDGNDSLYGGNGRDRLIGDLGDDLLSGGADADGFIGGGGADVFAFDSARDSTHANRDRILKGELGTAFGRPGETPGDLLELSAIDANADKNGDQAFSFGSAQGVARVWLDEKNRVTVVRANVDDDARAEFELAILDGSVRAADYTVDDFVL